MAAIALSSSVQRFPAFLGLISSSQYCCYPWPSTATLSADQFAMSKPTREQLLQWFNGIDRDGNGQLTALELQSALNLGGLSFSIPTVSHIIRINDRDNSGTIDFNEFERLHGFLSNVQASFDFFDSDHSGKLSMAEISAALSRAGFMIDGPALKAVFSRFDPLRTDGLDRIQFMELTLFLRSATATFNSFNPSSSGCIQLNFNQFLYACAHTI